MTIAETLREEIEERVAAMDATDDIPQHERERQALEDIVELDAEQYGAYNADEIARWRAVQKLARERLTNCV